MRKEKKNDKKKVDIKEFATIVKGKIRDFIRHPAVRALDEMKKADAKIPPIVHDEDNLLEVQNLKQYFPLKAGFFKRTVGYVRAVDGISFNIKRGTTMGLVGESGCGKTTTGRTILRLYKKTSGSVLFDGQEIFKLNKSQLRHFRPQIQIVFQYPYSSLSPETSRRGDHRRSGQRAQHRAQGGV